MKDNIKLKIPNHIQGILWMIVSCFFSSCMMALVRYTTFDFHPFQVTFFRNFFAFILFIPWLLRHGIKKVKTTRLPQYTIRALSGVTAMLMWFYALSLVPLSQATALSFTSPLITTFAAVLFLKEKMTFYRWGAIFIGFLGTFIILRPGFAGFNYISLFVLAATIFWAVSSLLIKSLTRTETPQVIVFYMTLIMTPLSLPTALLHWKMPHGEQWLALILLGIVSNLFQISLSYAFSKTDLTVILPFDFLRLIFTAIIAYLAFSEVIDAWTVLGSIIILGSTFYVTYKESRHKKRLKTAQTLANME